MNLSHRWIPPLPDPVRTNGLPAREVAWKVLLAVAAGAYADAALERELNRQSLSGADRALATELAYGAIRQRRLLDAWIDAHGRVRAEQQPPRLRWLLQSPSLKLGGSNVPGASACRNATTTPPRRSSAAASSVAAMALPSKGLAAAPASVPSAPACNRRRRVNGVEETPRASGVETMCCPQVGS